MSANLRKGVTFVQKKFSTCQYFGPSTLYFHRFSVKGKSKSPIWSGEPLNWGIKRRFLNAIDAHTCLAHRGYGWFVASIAGHSRMMEQYSCLVSLLWFQRYKCFKIKIRGMYEVAPFAHIILLKYFRSAPGVCLWSRYLPHTLFMCPKWDWHRVPCRLHCGPWTEVHTFYWITGILYYVYGGLIICKPRTWR